LACGSAQRQLAEAFDRAADREDAAWRKALHQECLQNINLGQEPPDGYWSFDTRVLSECSAHASAFSAAVLPRIIWARTASEKLEITLGHLRSGPALATDTASWEKALVDYRRRASGEISAIEVELRT